MTNGYVYAERVRFAELLRPPTACAGCGQAMEPTREVALPGGYYCPACVEVRALALLEERGLTREELIEVGDALRLVQLWRERS